MRVCVDACMVQETRDGAVVVFHDDTLGRAFPRAGNESAISALEKEGLNLATASVQVRPTCTICTFTFCFCLAGPGGNQLWSCHLDFP